jgi:uncharacterized PurR-regulated membrane protein YhhQ (DUF165 family)
MHTSWNADRWLLPSRQREYPSRVLLPEATLHVRREGTFLVLVALFLVSAAMLPVLGTGRLLDLSGIAPAFDLPIVGVRVSPLLAPGALAFPLTLLSAALVCELYGRRRGMALVLVGLAANLGLVGLLWVADAIPAQGGPAGVAPEDAAVYRLAFVSCYLAAVVASVYLYCAIGRRMRQRRRWLRYTVSALFGQGIGWSAFALVTQLHGSGLSPAAGPAPADLVASVTLTAGAYAVALSLASILPFYLAASGLSVYLRVQPLALEDREEPQPSAEASGSPAFVARAIATPMPSPRKLPVAEIADAELELADGDLEVVDEVPAVEAVPDAIPARGRPFSTDEVAFFEEGEEAARRELSADDSMSDLAKVPPSGA